MHKKRILILGDSHIHALKHAITARGEQESPVEFAAYRFSKLKDGTTVGDVDFDAAMEIVSSLLPDDMVVSAIGGNQHSTVGLIQHPEPFDFFEPGGDQGAVASGATLVPYNVVADFFLAGMRGGKNGPRLQQMRATARCAVYDLFPPPPKEDEAHILKRPEIDFARAGILERGISPAPLRLKIWKLQMRVMRQLCQEWGVELLLPPEEALTPDSFLKPQYYANDATHANAAYGELVLRQLEGIALADKASTVDA